TRISEFINDINTFSFGQHASLELSRHHVGALSRMHGLYLRAPHEISGYGIEDPERNSDYFKDSLPPLKGLIPGLLGFIFIAWGWWHLREERYLPFSGIVFLVGCLLWAIGCYFILPWSVGVMFFLPISVSCHSWPVFFLLLRFPFFYGLFLCCCAFHRQIVWMGFKMIPTRRAKKKINVLLRIFFRHALPSSETATEAALAALPSEAPASRGASVACYR